MRPTALRVTAFGIAALAIVDPTFTSTRSSRPIVAVLATNSALGENVRDVVNRRFVAVRGISDAASATVLVGAGVPDDAPAAREPMFGVVERGSEAGVDIVDITMPASAALDARTPLDVRIRTTRGRGREVDVEVFNGNSFVGSMKAPIRNDTSLVTATSSFVFSPGVQLLRAMARITGEAVADSAFAVLDVRGDRLPILFLDARPSWNSTFVRRALERDSRFSIVYRTQTSRGVSNVAGDAPSSAGDLESLRDYAVVVIGAPEALSIPEVVALESFMRRRGGRVIMLLDPRRKSAADRLLGVASWRTATHAAPSSVGDSSGREVLRARELVWPATLPEGATVHATNTARDSTARAIVWSVPVGAGRLLVSGAADAWHYRDVANGFDSFWTSTIASEALRAPPPIDVHLERRVLAPGDETTARITIRDSFLSATEVRSARAHAALTSGGDSTFVRLWPESTPGVFTARIVAPRQPGEYRLRVTSGVDRADVPLLAHHGAVLPGVLDRDLLRAFVSSRGGSVVDEGELDRLPDLISSAVQSVSRVESWHPMRSAWWLIPFVALLGVEWWWRRRHGLP